LAHFTDRGADPLDDEVVIDWGDGTPVEHYRGSIAAARPSDCTYLGTPVDTASPCFEIDAGHIYLQARPRGEPFTFTVTVTTEEGHSTTARGFAEVESPQDTGPQSRTSSIGLLTAHYTGTDRTLDSAQGGCTATLIEAPRVTMVVTAQHCYDWSKIDLLEFAPGHIEANAKKDRCNGKMLDACGGTNPAGIWTSSGGVGKNVWVDSRTHLFNSGEDFDYAFILLTPPAALRAADEPSMVPISFFYAGSKAPGDEGQPSNQAWSAYGYLARVDSANADNLHSCQGDLRKSQPVLSAGLPIERLGDPADDVAIAPCNFGGPNVIPDGSSGGPYINSSNTLPEAIGAVHERWYPTGKALGTSFGTSAAQLITAAVFNGPTS